MYTLARIAALLLAASAVTAAPVDLVTRTEKPATYAEGYLENYTVYHTRYLALSCQDKHNTDFFDKCCHPMLATETLEKNRAPECTPNASAAASASAAEPTSTVEADDGTEECEDEEPSSPAPAPTPSPSPKKEEQPKKEEPKPATTKKVEAAAPSPSPKKDDNNNKGNNNNNNNNSGSSNPVGNLIQGGHITFYEQNGVAGACGKVHSDNDLIAAMDSRRYKNGELCGKQVNIKNKANGNAVTVTIADECPTCDNGNSIDLSHAAFQKLAAFDVGLLTDVEWSFV